MRVRGQHGYAMVALLVGLSIMAVMMTAVMPTWRQAVQREKEAELVFRGQQYARAIGLFQRKSGPGVLPPNLDVLVGQRFLRRKYTDPVTGGDFDLLSAVQPAAGSSAPGGTPATRSPTPSGALASPTPQQGRGGIMGVASKSKAASIRIYNGRTHYNEWQFLYVAQTQAPGSAGNPGGRGQPQRGDQPGQAPSGFLSTGGGRGLANGASGRGQQAPQGRGAGPSQVPIGPPRR